MSCNDETSDEVLAGIYRGDTLALRVRFDDANSSPVDVTGWTWLCQLRTQMDNLVTMLAVDTEKAGSGELTLSLTPEYTATMAVGDYAFDLQATDTEATVRTVLTGRLRVRADVSRVTP